MRVSRFHFSRTPLDCICLEADQKASYYSNSPYSESSKVRVLVARYNVYDI